VRLVRLPANDDRSAPASLALNSANGEFVTFMAHTDELSQIALYMLVEELNQHPSSDVIYSDEDKIDTSGGRHEPHFKPDWNGDFFHGFNYVGNLTAYRTSLVREVGGLRSGFSGALTYDLLLRMIERITPDKIRHVPF